MLSYKEYLEEKVLYQDEHGKHIIYDDGRYKVSMNNENDPNYFVVWYNNNKVGVLSLKTTSKKINNEDWASVDYVEVDLKHRKIGIGKLLYKLALENINEKYSGIVSYLLDRSNKKAIPKLYKKMGSEKIKEYPDYEFIRRK